MTHQNLTYTVVDPTTLEGNPFEVADRAVRQAEAIAKALDIALKGAHLMARNAEMERDLLAGREPDAAAFEESAQGKKLAAIRTGVRASIKALGVVAQAASYDPKNPPKADD